MDVTYEQSDPGNGFFICKNLREASDRLQNEPFSVYLCRSGDMRYLCCDDGAATWCDQKNGLPDACERYWNDGVLYIHLPPFIVDALDREHKYELSFDNSCCGVFIASDVVRSWQNKPTNAGNSGDDSDSSEAVVQADDTHTLSDTQRTQVTQSDDASAQSDTGITIDTGTQRNTIKSAISHHEQPKVDTPRGKWLWPGLAAAVAVVIMIAVYVLKPSEPACILIHKPVNATSAGPSPVPLDKIRASNGEWLSPDQALIVLEEHPSVSREDQDEICRLSSFAYNKGKLQAVMKYAYCIDPLMRTMGTFKKNAYHAWKLYREAADKGMAQAKQNLRSLEGWIEQEAGRGNPEAVEAKRLVDAEK